ncbi:MAG TPA: MFS transporter, partial [Gemmatimonadaceae bacterium]|nr:MFS transporter [Gemmatimonadaceae bacterium]
HRGKGNARPLRFGVPETRKTKTDPYASLRLPGFRLYIVGLFAYTMAIQIQGTVVGWQIYELTHDKLALGLIGLAEAFPFIGAALYAGHVADTHDRRRIMLTSLGVLLFCAVSLLALPFLLPSAPQLVVRAIYGVIVLSGLARSFLQPARQALAAEMVPRPMFGNAIAWRSGSWQLAAVMGPAIGGLLFALGGSRLAYSVDAGLMLMGVAAIVMITHQSTIKREHVEAMTKSLATGIKFVFNEPIILGALSLDLFSVLFGGATALLPVYADEILHVGPSGLGILRAAPAIGAVIMSGVIAWMPPFKRTGRALFSAVATFGLCIIVFGLSTSMILSVTVLVLSGAADMVSVFTRSSLLQHRTPTHMFGRVSSVNSMFIGSSNEIGAFESGVTAKLFGTVPSVVLGGVLTLVVVAVTAWRIPSLRKLGKMETTATP